jgi:hypothetical protein
MGSVNIHIKKENIKQVYFDCIRKLNPTHEFPDKYLDLRLSEQIKNSYGLQLPYSDVIFITRLVFDNIENENEYYGREYTIEQKICEIISHEEIHMSLENLEGFNTAYAYDNIKEKLRFDGYMA